MPKKPRRLQFRPKKRQVHLVKVLEPPPESREQQQDTNKPVDSVSREGESQFIVQSLLLIPDADRRQIEEVQNKKDVFHPVIKEQEQFTTTSEGTVTIEHNYCSNLKSKVKHVSIREPVSPYSREVPGVLFPNRGQQAEDLIELYADEESLHPKDNENQHRQVVFYDEDCVVQQQQLVQKEVVQEDIIVQEETVEYMHQGDLNYRVSENSGDHRVGYGCPQMKTKCIDSSKVNEKIDISSDSVCKFISEFQGELPPLWTSLVGRDGTLHILRLSPHESKVTQRSICIKTNRELKLFVHGSEIKGDHDVFKEMPAVNFRSSGEFNSSVIKVLDHFRSFDVCSGVPHKKYQSFWPRTPGCLIDKNVFHEVRFDVTCRAEDCCLIVPYIRKRCENCNKVFKVFARQKLPESSEGPREPPNKYHPLKYMNSPEKDARIKERGRIIQNLKNVNKRLQEKLNKLVAAGNIQVNENQQLNPSNSQ